MEFSMHEPTHEHVKFAMNRNVEGKKQDLHWEFNFHSI